MSEAEGPVETTYGRLDRVALNQVRANYDTQVLLRTVEELDRFLATSTREDGLRDQLIRVHAMAHTVINGAAMAPAADDETLPELAQDVLGEIYLAMSTMRSWIKRLDSLAKLAAPE